MSSPFPSPVLGTAGPDSLAGNAAADWLDGLGGDDTLSGLDGNDTLQGGDGADTLLGGAGDDVLEDAQGLGNTLVGGPGADSFALTRALVPVTSSALLAWASLADAAGDAVTAAAFALGEAVTLDFTAAGLTWLGGRPFTGRAGEGRLEWQALRNTAPATPPDLRFVATLGFDLDGDFRADASMTLSLATGSVWTTSWAGGRGLVEVSPGRLALVGPATLAGTAGNDVLTGGDAVDTLLGDAGEDRLAGGLMPDWLAGGAGNDTFVISTRDDLAQDTLLDFAAGDVLDVSALRATFIGTAAFSGLDQLRLDIGPGGTRLLLSTGWSPPPTMPWHPPGGWTAIALQLSAEALDLAESSRGSGLFSTRFLPVVLQGGPGDDALAGGEGSDTLDGLAGADTLDGLAGNDALDGGAGDDTLMGGAGADTLLGGAGDDLLLPGLGADTLVTGGGGDTIRYASLAEAIGDGIGSPVNGLEVQVGTRLDFAAAGILWRGTAAFTGRAGEARLEISQLDLGGGPAPLLTGMPVRLLFDADGDGAADGALGLALALEPGGMLAGLEETAPGSGILLVKGGWTLEGTPGDDVLHGDSAPSTLLGGAGDDRLTGGPGPALMFGGPGRDTFVIPDVAAATGIPLISGRYQTLRWGADTIADFAAEDRLDLSALGLRFIGDGAFTDAGQARRAVVGGDTVVQVSTSWFPGGFFQSPAISREPGWIYWSLTLAPGDLPLFETAPGSGILTGLDPRIIAAGTPGADALVGGPAADTLAGLGGADTLDGLGGDDTLIGGPGDDLLLGGAGRDIAVTSALRGEATLARGGGAVTLAGAEGTDTLRGMEAVRWGDGTVTGLLPVPGDADGNGTADRLRQDAATGAIAIATTLDGPFVALPAMGSGRVVGRGDLDADGRGDLLTQGADGMVALVLGGDAPSRHEVGVVAAWRPVALADVNGDGHADVIWRAGSAIATWLMDGLQPLGSAFSLFRADAWDLVGARDATGDGRADLLMRNPDGLLLLLPGQADGGFGAWEFIGRVPDGWLLEGFADMNADGMADLLLHHPGTGWVGAWTMERASVTGWHGIANLPSAARLLPGDVDGDGMEDLLVEGPGGVEALILDRDGVSARVAVTGGLADVIL